MERVWMIGLGVKALTLEELVRAMDDLRHDGYDPIALRVMDPQTERVVPKGACIDPEKIVSLKIICERYGEPGGVKLCDDLIAQARAGKGES